MPVYQHVMVHVCEGRLSQEDCVLEGSLGNRQNGFPVTPNYTVRSCFRKMQTSEINEFLKILFLLFKHI